MSYYTKNDLKIRVLESRSYWELVGALATFFHFWQPVERWAIYTRILWFNWFHTINPNEQALSVDALHIELKKRVLACMDEENTSEFWVAKFDVEGWRVTPSSPYEIRYDADCITFYAPDREAADDLYEKVIVPFFNAD